MTGTSSPLSTWLSRHDRRRRDIAFALVDALATLGAMDHTEVELADFGKPDGFLERQALDPIDLKDAVGSCNPLARLTDQIVDVGGPAAGWSMWQAAEDPKMTTRSTPSIASSSAMTSVGPKLIICAWSVDRWPGGGIGRAKGGFAPIAPTTSGRTFGGH